MLEKITTPSLHCKEELIKDLEQAAFTELMMKWFHDRYSTSKHLLTLYSIVKGLNAKRVVEVGFGRSTYVIANAVAENGGKMYCCDRYDYTPLLTDREKKVITFVQGDAKKLLKTVSGGFDFVFLDYLSSRERSADSCYKAMCRFLELTKQNGVMAIHDTFEEKYNAKDAMKNMRKNKTVECMTLPYNYGLGLIRKLSKSEHGTIKDVFEKKEDSK